MRDTPSMAPKALISFPDILLHASDDVKSAIEQGSWDSTWLQPGIAACMQSTAASLQCMPHEVIWVTQLAYKVHKCGGSLCTTGDTAGFESALALTMHHTASVAERLLLEAEHQYLEQGLTDVSKGAQGLNETTNLIDQLRVATDHRPAGPLFHIDTAHDGRVLHQLCVQCGAAASTPLADAVESVVRVMLRKDMSALPHSLWQAGCMRVLRWLQGCVDDMIARTPDAEVTLKDHVRAQQPASGHLHHSSLPLSLLPAAHLIMTQAMLREVISVMHAPSVQVECLFLRFWPASYRHLPAGLPFSTWWCTVLGLHA